MRRCRRLLVAVGLSLAFVTATGGPAAAHPLGNFTVNHFSGIEVFPDRVVIHYVVDMAEIPTFQELPLMDANNDDNVSSSELQSFAYDTGAGVLTNLSLLSDGQRVELRLDDARARFRRGQGGLNILRVEATLHGLLNESAATLTYEDRNYPARLGWKEIVAYGSGGQGIVSSSVPSESVSDELRSYPNNLLSSPLEVTEATVRVAPGAAPRSADARSGTPAAAETDFITAAFASLIEEKFSPGFFSVALALAIGAGALHALGPGHGKTVMAAYLVGTQGRARHALSVGVAISLMHTTSVVVLGLITLLASSLFPPESVYPWLSLASGVVVLCLGASLLRSRLRSRKHPAGGDDGNAQHHEHSHVHPAHEHQHSHDHGRPHSHGLGPHDHGPRNRAHESPLSWRGLVALGLSGGLLPSPTALVVLLGAVALHRIAFGVALVAAFSVGLAGALTLMGLVVLRARSYAAARLSGSSMSLLPIGSAALILAIGLFLTTRAALGL